MANLFTIAPSGYEIHGDPDDPGPWACTCRHGQDHLRPGKLRGQLCKHLQSLFGGAEEREEVDIAYFVPTADGDHIIGNCRCKGQPARPLHRVHVYQAPPEKRPGEPSRNRPCPCGWVDPAIGRVREYKRCHGAEGGPPPGAPKWKLRIKLTPEEKKEAAKLKRHLRYEREKGRKLEQKLRVRDALKHAEEADEKRRQKRKARYEREKAAKTAAKGEKA